MKKVLFYLRLLFLINITSAAHAVLVHFEWDDKEPTIQVAFLTAQQKADVWEITDSLNLEGKNYNHYMQLFVDKTYEAAEGILRDILFACPTDSRILLKFSDIHCDYHVQKLIQFLSLINDIEATENIPAQFNICLRCAVIQETKHYSLTESQANTLRNKVIEVMSTFERSRRER